MDIDYYKKWLYNRKTRNARKLKTMQLGKNMHFSKIRCVCVCVDGGESMIAALVYATKNVN